MKTPLLATSIFLFILSAVAAQRPCDTLVISDGSIILAQIIRTREGSLYYYKCEDFVKTELFIARSSVIGFKPSREKEKQLLVLDLKKKAEPSPANPYSHFKIRNIPCDTLLTTDGRQIIARIISNQEGMLHYVECNDKTRIERTIPRQNIQSYRPKMGYDAREAARAEKAAISDQRFLSRHSIAFLTGLNPVDLFTSPATFLRNLGTNVETISMLQYGMQYQRKNLPYQFLVMVRPYQYEESNEEAFRARGINAELSFTVKKIMVGKYTGIIKGWYWGAEFQYGRRGYEYLSPNPALLLPSIRIQTEGTAFATLARFGIQQESGIFYWDVAGLLGIRKIIKKTDNPTASGPSVSGISYLSFQPVMNLGIRF
ncbi:MAG: hypothetical protein J0M29_13980 [Chitinophagales bacterium]|nr:hypothetical protein [Chitinophagales bacterium]